MREHARERQDPGRLRQPPDRAHGPARGSTTGSRPARRPAPSAGGCSTSCFRSRDAGRLANRAFVDARLKPILERHHQLDALERAQPELLERRACRSRRARGRSARSALRRESPRSGATGAAPECTHSRIAARFSFRVPSVRGSSARSRPTPCGCAGDPGAVRWPRARSPSGSTPGSSTQHRVHALLGPLRSRRRPPTRARPAARSARARRPPERRSVLPA